MVLVDSSSSKKMSIFNGFYTSTFVRFLSVFVAFFLNIVIARVLGKEAFGLFVFLTSVSLFIAILSSFGLGRIALRMFASAQSRKSMEYRSQLFERFFILWAAISLVVFSVSLFLYFMYFEHLPFMIEWLVAVMSITYGVLVGWRIIAVDIYVAN